MVIKAGDYVYENHTAETRGELEELVADCVLAVCKDQSDRASNGASVDAMLSALDQLVYTLEQWDSLKKILGTE